MVHDQVTTTHTLIPSGPLLQPAGYQATVSTTHTTLQLSQYARHASLVFDGSWIIGCEGSVSFMSVLRFNRLLRWADPGLTTEVPAFVEDYC